MSGNLAVARLHQRLLGHAAVVSRTGHIGAGRELPPDEIVVNVRMTNPAARPRRYIVPRAENDDSSFDRLYDMFTGDQALAKETENGKYRAQLMHNDRPVKNNSDLLRIVDSGTGRDVNLYYKVDKTKPTTEANKKVRSEMLKPAPLSRRLLDMQRAAAFISQKNVSAPMSANAAPARAWHQSVCDAIASFIVQRRDASDDAIHAVATQELLVRRAEWVRPESDSPLLRDNHHIAASMAAADLVQTYRAIGTRMQTASAQVIAGNMARSRAWYEIEEYGRPRNHSHHPDRRRHRRHVHKHRGRFHDHHGGHHHQHDGGIIRYTSGVRDNSPPPRSMLPAKAHISPVGRRMSLSSSKKTTKTAAMYDEGDELPKTSRLDNSSTHLSKMGKLIVLTYTVYDTGKPKKGVDKKDHHNHHKETTVPAIEAFPKSKLPEDDDTFAPASTPSMSTEYDDLPALEESRSESAAAPADDEDEFSSDSDREPDDIDKEFVPTQRITGGAGAADWPSKVPQPASAAAPAKNQQRRLLAPIEALVQQPTGASLLDKISAPRGKFNLVVSNYAMVRRGRMVKTANGAERFVTAADSEAVRVADLTVLASTDGGATRKVVGTVPYAAIKTITLELGEKGAPIRYEFYFEDRTDPTRPLITTASLEPVASGNYSITIRSRNQNSEITRRTKSVAEITDKTRAWLRARVGDHIKAYVVTPDPTTSLGTLIETRIGEEYMAVPSGPVTIKLAGRTTSVLHTDWAMLQPGTEFSIDIHSNGNGGNVAKITTVNDYGEEKLAHFAPTLEAQPNSTLFVHIDEPGKVSSIDHAATAVVEKARRIGAEFSVESAKGNVYDMIAKGTAIWDKDDNAAHVLAVFAHPADTSCTVYVLPTAPLRNNKDTLAK